MTALSPGLLPSPSVPQNSPPVPLPRTALPPSPYQDGIRALEAAACAVPFKEQQPLEEQLEGAVEHDNGLGGSRGGRHDAGQGG